MVAFRNRWNDLERTNLDGSTPNRELEAYFLKVIGEKKTASKDDLAENVRIEDEFDMKMWLMTLECKGLIEMAGNGYRLTAKGRAKLGKI